MPLYHFAHADAAEQVAVLEAAGESVVSITADDSGVYVATTVAKASRAKPKDVETR